MKNYVRFKNPYILIEDAKNKFQPFYKEYSFLIPYFRFDSPKLCCPFSEARRSENPKKKTQTKTGYCEVCYVKFDNYEEHVNTQCHQEYAQDDYNYRCVDIFIRDMLVEEINQETYILNSPCERLEAKFASNSQLFYCNDSASDSLIRVSHTISQGSDDVVGLDTILNKIEKNDL